MTTLAMDKQIDFRAFSLLTPSTYITVSHNWVFSNDFISSISISSSVNNTLAILMRKGVAIEDFLTVEKFLSYHYEIVASLYGAFDSISQHFDKSSIKLGLFLDPDSDIGNSELYFEVETSLSPEHANEQLAKINKEWLVDSKNKDLASVNITLKFI